MIIVNDKTKIYAIHRKSFVADRLALPFARLELTVSKKREMFQLKFSAKNIIPWVQISASFR